MLSTLLLRELLEGPASSGRKVLEPTADAFLGPRRVLGFPRESVRENGGRNGLSILPYAGGSLAQESAARGPKLARTGTSDALLAGGLTAAGAHHPGQAW